MRDKNIKGSSENTLGYLAKAGFTDTVTAKSGYSHPKGRGEGFIDDANLYLTTLDREEIINAMIDPPNKFKGSMKGVYKG